MNKSNTPRTRAQALTAILASAAIGVTGVAPAASYAQNGAKPPAKQGTGTTGSGKVNITPGGQTPVAPGTPPAGTPDPTKATVIPVPDTSRGTGSGRQRGGTVSMDFRGADIGNVLKFFSMATGWQIIPDPLLAGQVTIISPKQLTIDQAFEVLQATLAIRGFTGQLEQHGPLTILKIVQFDAAVKGSSLFNNDGKIKTPDEMKNQVITQVIPIENVDAKALATELMPLVSKGASLVGSAGTNSLIITDTATNVKRIEAMVQMLDKTASSNEIKMFTLLHSDANDVAQILNGLFTKVFSRGKNTSTPAANPNGGPQPPPQMDRNGQPIAQQGADRAAIVAIPDNRTNSLFVVGSKDNLARVEDIINKLDNPESTALTTSIRKMKFGDAIDIADTVNSVLSGTIPGRNSSGANGGGASFAQRIFGGFGGFGGGGGSTGTTSTDPFAKVVGNARTNSLIITATKERLEKVNSLIDELDVKVTVEPTTFVVQLNNAQASDIATILGQAFGTTTGGGGNFGGNNGFGNNGFGNNGNNANRNGAGGNRAGSGRPGTGVGTGIGGRGVPISGLPSMGASNFTQDGVAGVLTADGFIPDPTSVTRAAQFGFGGGGFGGGGFGGFGGGRGGGGQMQQTPQFGRSATGQYSNLLQFRQNVAVVADPNSNSLVITTLPEYLPYIKQLIESLDIIPRQVMIEVIIAEASIDATQKLGFQFDAKGNGKLLGSGITQNGSSGFPVSGAGTTASNIASALVPGIQYGVQAISGKFNALVQALAVDNKVKILSTPKIFASNNQAATIAITTDIPYIASTTVNALGTGNTNNYSFINAGVTLDVTPRITKDGRVTLLVNAVASEFLGFDTLSTTANANGQTTTQLQPRTSTRSADTVVSAKDNEIIAIGGLMRDSVTNVINKVPILGDIPIIGHLFRSSNKNTQKSELMIFLIPHVADTDQKISEITQKTSANIQKLMPDLPALQPGLVPKDKRVGGELKKPDNQKTLPKKSDMKKPDSIPGDPNPFDPKKDDRNIEPK